MERFLRRWGINANAIGNYSGGKCAGIDWARLSERVEKSTFLRQQKAIGFYIEHYEDILDGKYDDFDKRRPSGYSEAEREAKMREYDEIMRRAKGGV